MPIGMEAHLRDPTAMGSSEGGRPLLGYLLAAFAALFWAVAGLTAKWLFSKPWLDVDPLDVAAARSLVSFVVLVVALGMVRRDTLRIRMRQLPFLALFGIGGMAMMHFAYFSAIDNTNVATAIMLQYLAPILVLVISVTFLKERFSWVLPIAVMLAVGGCALLVGVGSGGILVSRAGLFWGLAACCFYTGYIIMGKWASSRYSPWTLSTYGFLWATLLWLVVMRGPGRLEVFADGDALAAVLVVSLVGTVAPFSLFLMALRHVGATRASITTTLEPVLGGVAAYFLFDEALGWLQICGALLVIAAIAAVQLSQLYLERRRPVAIAAKKDRVRRTKKDRE